MAHLSPSSDDLSQAYERYRRELKMFFARHAPQAHLVDDLMQIMFVQLIRSRSTEVVRDPKQYLFRTAWNILHNSRRRLRRDRSRTVSSDSTGFDSYAQRSNLLWIEDDTGLAVQQAELNRVLKELPPAWQVAVLRQYRDNRSYQQIADELGISVHTVKKYIMQSLNHFRRHFTGMEVRSLKSGERP